MDFSRLAVVDAGFVGFVPFPDLPVPDVPRGQGVYLVFRDTGGKPDFLPSSGAGWFKGRDPSVADEILEDAWVDGARVLYIGKAGAGARGTRGLRKRLTEYQRHGSGDKVGHWGGRYIWQLADQAEVVVAWKETPDEDPEDVETLLINQFVARFGSRPFANRKRGRSQRI